MNNISVIIPTSSRNIDTKVIENIKKTQPLEIIIVGDNININIHDKIIKCYETQKKNNAAVNRNFGASKASGDYLLFLDDDVLVDYNFILENFVNTNIKYDIIYGVYSKLDPKKNFLNFYQNEIVRHRSKTCKLFSSSHFIINKEVFIKLQGFNEELQSYEDIEFYNRACKEKFNLFYNKKFTVHHLKKFTLMKLIKDHFSKVKNSILAKEKYKNIFEKSTVDLLTKINFLSFPIFLLIASFLLLFNSNSTLYYITIFLFILTQYFILKKIFKQINSKYFIYSLFFTIIISCVSVIAVIYSNISKYKQLIFKFFLSSLDYLRMLKRVLIRNGYPIQIIHYVTARCNLRCEHCFYKETLDKEDPGEQELEIFRKTSKAIGPVLWYALAGGEVFIRKDFVSLMEIIIKECRPKYISIPTNGWYTERTHDYINKILRKHPNIFFSLYFSIDGYEDIHDKIRGNNSFKKLKDTYFGLKKLQMYYKNFNLNIVTTITDQNYKDSEGFIEYISKEFNPNAISINLFRYHSLKHPKLPDHLIDAYNKAYEKYFVLLDKNKISGLKNIFRQIFTYKDKIQKFIITRVARYNEFVTPCTAGNLSYVIMEDGKVKPCEILDDSIGNVNYDENLKEIFTSNKSKKLRKWIKDTECKCTYECAMSTNALFSWPMTKKYFGLLYGKKI